MSDIPDELSALELDHLRRLSLRGCCDGAFDEAILGALEARRLAKPSDHSWELTLSGWLAVRAARMKGLI